MAASREEITAEVASGRFWLAQALDAVRDPILIIDISDASFSILFANAVARKRVGHLDSPIVGAPVGDFLELSSIESFANSVRLLSSSNTSHVQKISWRLAELGGDFATEFKLLLEPQFGAAVMLTLPSLRQSPGHSAEVSQAGQALTRATEWLKLSMRAAQMYAWRWDRGTDSFEFVLPDNLVRYLPPDFRSMDGFLTRVHADDAERVSCAVRLALEQGVEIMEEFRFRLDDGAYRWYVVVGRPLLAENGAVCGLVGATQDVTSRRSAQARVREYGDMLSTATAQTADVLLLLDAQLNIRFCNRSIGGFNPQQLVGMSASNALSGSDWDVQSQLLRSVLQGAPCVSFGHESLNEDGQLHRYESRAVPVCDNGLVTGLSVTVADITERMRLEREILGISTREQERIGQDLHDGLGQELTGIALMLRSLANRVHRDFSAATGDVDEIVALVNHTIESTRSLARGLSPLNPGRGGLVHALRALAVRSGELYGLNVHFRSKVWPQLTLDEARSNHLYRIAQEALTNVARHAQATRAEVRLQVSDGKYTLSIADDGVGLSQSFKSSNGLGLKLMAYRAGTIGAKLEIVANEPKGTMVQICGEQPPVM